MITTTIEQLIEKLDALMASGEFTVTVDEDTEERFLGGDAVIELDQDASGVLIEVGGHPDYEAMIRLRELSDGRYYVTPGETDSFGWLTGCLHTPAGIIVYG